MFLGFRNNFLLEMEDLFSQNKNNLTSNTQPDEQLVYLVKKIKICF